MRTTLPCLLPRSLTYATTLYVETPCNAHWASTLPFSRPTILCSGYTQNRAYNGYSKNGWAPPRPNGESCALATVWAAHGSHAVVAVANYCGASVSVDITLNWDELGLDAGTAVATLPGVAGVQDAQALPNGNGGGGWQFLLGTDGGLFIFISATGAAK